MIRERTGAWNCDTASTAPCASSSQFDSAEVSGGCSEIDEPVATGAKSDSEAGASKDSCSVDSWFMTDAMSPIGASNDSWSVESWFMIDAMSAISPSVNVELRLADGVVVEFPPCINTEPGSVDGSVAGEVVVEISSAATEGVPVAGVAGAAEDPVVLADELIRD